MHPAPEPAPPGQETRATGRSPSRRWLVTASVAVVYLALSVLANRSAWAHGIAHSIQTSGGNDVPEEIWFLAQTPWVLLHGHNPLVNDWLNAPVGVNLMDNTTMPLLGIVGFPITVLFGPIATYNVLIDLAIFASALSFFAMARRFVTWWPAAFVGGLAYGFSPFTAATGNAHLFLLFQAVPPLVILFVDRFLRSASASPWWAGLAVGLCFVAEFYISTEAFASLVVMTGIALVVAGAFALRARLPFDGRRLLRMGGCAVMVIVLGTGYAAWVAVAGPHHITGPAQPATVLAGESVDPFGLVVPTLDQHFSLGHAALGDSFVAVRDPNWHIVVESPLENGSYIGVPLLVALVIGAIVLRRKRIALFSAVMGASALVLSLGPHLHVDGHRTDIPLPFIVLTHVPLLDSSEAARWETYFWLFAALLLALLLDAVVRAVSATPRAGRRAGAAAGGLLAVVLLLPLVPAWPYASAAADVPAWFTHGARSLPPGRTPSSIRWPPLPTPRPCCGRPWPTWISACQEGSRSFRARRAPTPWPVNPPRSRRRWRPAGAGTEGAARLSARDVRAQLDRWRTRTVAVVPTAPGAACATALFTGALGPARAEGGVLVWPHLTSAS